MTARPGGSLSLGLLALVVCACSAVETAWVEAGYDSRGQDAVKRIAIVSWAPVERPELAELLSRVATDRIKLRTSYLVYQSATMSRGWSDACSQPKPTCPQTPERGSPAAEPEPPADDTTADDTTADESPPLEGVLSIRALAIEKIAADVKLALVAELHSCQSGALLWRVEGSEGNPAADDDLAALTKSYIDNLGAAIEPFAAPVFLVLRDILDTLPDVVLTDDEVMEKIELE